MCEKIDKMFEVPGAHLFGNLLSALNLRLRDFQTAILLQIGEKRTVPDARECTTRHTVTQYAGLHSHII